MAVAALAHAAHMNAIAALERVTALGPGGEAAHVGPWAIVHAGPGYPDFNRALVACPEGMTAGALGVVADYFRSRGSGYRLVLRRSGDGSVLAEAAAAGFRQVASEPAMVLDGCARPRRTLPTAAVARAVTAAEISAFAALEPGDPGDDAVREAVAARAAMDPGCALFLARDGGTIVGRAMALLTPGITGIYNVYVRPSHRGQGYGAALTAAAVEWGAAHGSAGACLVASTMGFPVYQRLGFQRVDDYVSLQAP
jgi:GNAT superfamily N-acetyltransferase